MRVRRGSTGAEGRAPCGFTCSPPDPAATSRSEHAIRELPVGPPGEAQAWAEDRCNLEEGQRVISRSEAHMVPLYRDAIERWELGDDAVLQSTEVAEVLDGRRREATWLTELGCRESDRWGNDESHPHSVWFEIDR